MAEEQNSEHVVSLLRYRMRDVTGAELLIDGGFIAQ